MWHESGTGDAFRYDSGGTDAMKGTSVLRLHVDAGGASTFVLSDEMPVLPTTSYVVNGWMRYSLRSEEDSVFFSVIQFNLTPPGTLLASMKCAASKATITGSGFPNVS